MAMSEFMGQMVMYAYLMLFCTILFYFLAFKWLSKWSKTTELGQKTKEASKGFGAELGKLVVALLMKLR